ncbi:MAG: hypothetical protein KDB27_19735, partial [Planctomycetales bacterium]|nr:hypothetical protein [Planctomycetales bacterium]
MSKRNGNSPLTWTLYHRVTGQTESFDPVTRSERYRATIVLWRQKIGFRLRCRSQRTVMSSSSSIDPITDADTLPRPKRGVRIAHRYLRALFQFFAAFAFIILSGCGTTRERLATDQLLLSDAVDRCIAHIDFSPLAGDQVFLDTQYIRSVKSTSVVNADYIVSSLRQQMLQAGCLLQDTRDEADIIVEARVGTLGHDAHDINYGLPANNALKTAAEITGNAPVVPAMPDVSLAKKTEESAAAKVAVFAYRRESKEPVWQSGLSVARSTAKNKWIMGAGPFQSGEIYKGTYFAGKRLKKKQPPKDHAPGVETEEAFRSAAVFDEETRQKLRRQILGELPEDHAPTSAVVESNAPPSTDVP